MGELTLETAREVAARIWCDQEYSHIVFDPELAEKIALQLYEHANKERELVYAQQHNKKIRFLEEAKKEERDG